MDLIQLLAGIPIAQASQGGGGAGGVGAIIGIVYLAFIIFMIASVWKVFSKAGQPGWGCIIPIYNAILFLKIAGKPLWWFILFFIPLVNIIVGIIALVAVAEKFGKGAGFAVGMLLLPFIFYPILGFGSAQYEGGAEPAPE